MYKENKLGVKIFINVYSIPANRPNNYIASKITKNSISSGIFDNKMIYCRVMNGNFYGFYIRKRFK